MPKSNIPQSKRVTVKQRYSWQPPDTVVLIADDGTVHTEDGTLIGRVEKGSRVYSPPTHKGSRIVRYHKRVAEWHGWYPDAQRFARPGVRKDTRAEVLRVLLEALDG